MRIYYKKRDGRKSTVSIRDSLFRELAELIGENRARQRIREIAADVDAHWSEIRNYSTRSGFVSNVLLKSERSVLHGRYVISSQSRFPRCII